MCSMSRPGRRRPLRRRLALEHETIEIADLADRIDVERLAPALRMSAHERMNDERGDGATLLLRQAHELPLAVPALIDVACLEAVDPPLGFLRQAVIGLVHVDEWCLAAGLR